MKRYIATYSCKEGFEERYRVYDTEANAFISEPLPYHLANDKAGALNGDHVSQEQAPASNALTPDAILHLWTAPIQATP